MQIVSTYSQTQNYADKCYDVNVLFLKLSCSHAYTSQSLHYTH